MGLGPIFKRHHRLTLTVDADAAARCGYTLKVHLHLKFIRRELLRELFSPHNRKKWAHNPLLTFSVQAKVDHKVSVNVHT